MDERWQVEMDVSQDDLDGLTAWTLIRAAHRVEQQLTELFASRGLSPVQFGVLAHLATGVPLTRAQLAREVLVRPQSIAGVLDGLTARGLVLDRGRRGKGRPNPVTISPQGREVLTEVWPAVLAATGPAGLGLSTTDGAHLDRILFSIIRPGPGPAPA